MSSDNIDDPHWREDESEASDPWALLETVRDENERLRDRIDEHHRMFEPMRAEIERLRGEKSYLENEIIPALRGECERLQAENAELKAEVQKLYDNWARAVHDDAS
jgi:predicted nuclease with TOPRIM domain